jgi:hypothetical protein
MTFIVIVVVIGLLSSSHPIQAANRLQSLPATTTNRLAQTFGSGNLIYHGGPIQRSPVSYIIFWGNAWNNGSGGLTGDAQIAKNYFTDVGGTSFFAVLTQYSDTNGAVMNTHTLGGVWLDATSPPTDGSCGGSTIQDAAIQSEVSHAIATQGWPIDTANSTYYVFTPNGAYVNDGTGGCSQKQFCSYHNWSSSTGVAYAAVAYPLDLTACGAPSSPNGNTQGDALAYLTAQTQLSAILNPHLTTGWFDSKAFEINTKCANNFGSGVVQLKNGRSYALQTMFSNSGSVCTTTYVSHFVASPTNFALVTFSSGMNPGPQILTLSNSGVKPLTWNLSASLPSWLTLSTTSGSIPSGGNQNLTLTFSLPSSSSTQYYETALQFSDTGADNSPFTVPVSVVQANVAKTWYFAEGYTGGSFSEYLTLANPGSSAANVQVTYLLGSGTPLIKSYAVNPNARRTLLVNAEVGANQNVSMVVTSDQPIVAERPMYFTYTGIAGLSIPGGHDVLGATSLGQDFAFGYLDTTARHATYLTILNQNSSALGVTVSYFAAAGGAPMVRTHSVGANSRGTINVNAEGLPAGSYSALVHLDAPGLVERPLYFVDSLTGYTGAADVVGVSQPLNNWYFAEGYTAANFSERYLLSNPNPSGVASVTVTFLKSDGSTVSNSLSLAPGQQQVVNANSVLGSGGVNNSAVVSATGATILAERLMSFRYTGVVGAGGASAIPGATDVLGAGSPGHLFLFAEGYTGGQFGEYLTLENPDATQTAHVTVRYLPDDGSAPTTQVYLVGPKSRYTVLTNAVMLTRSFSMVVLSNLPIVAERPMYFAYQGIQTGGSDVIGYQP